MILSNSRVKLEIGYDIYGRFGVRFISGDWDYFLYTIRNFPLATFDRKDKIWRIPPELGLALINHFNLPQSYEVVAWVKKNLSLKQNLKVGDEIFSRFYPKLLHSKLKTKLYPFQEEGVKFLLGTKSAILNADIGLGKTLMALTASLIMYEKWRNEIKNKMNVKDILNNRFRVLIVCPSSLKYHWEEQIKLHLNSVPYTVVDGGRQVRKSQYEYPSLLTITSYELVRQDWDIKILKKIPFNIIILDEVTRIKNFRTKTHRNVRKIPSVYKWGLTGSAVENSPVDLYSIFDWLDRDKFNGDWWKFKQNFLITQRNTLPDGRSYEMIVGYKNLDLLRTLTKPYIFIRKKRDVFKELPPVVKKNYWIPLTPIQEEAYEEIRRKVMEGEIEQLAGITYLREVVNSTSLLDKFDFPPSSSKISELLNLLDEVNEKVLIFTQFKKFADEVVGVLKNKNYKVLEISGEDTSDEKMRKVEKFNKSPNKLILVATDVIAYGMNLQEACSFLINLDLPWNPMKLENRIGRLDRLGQKNSVTVINFLTKSTVEEKVYKILTEKRELINKLLAIDTKRKGWADDEFVKWLLRRE